MMQISITFLYKTLTNSFTSQISILVLLPFFTHLFYHTTTMSCYRGKYAGKSILIVELLFIKI